MTVRAIAGVFLLSAVVLCVGLSILWALRGWRWWTEAVRLAGVAYLLGAAGLMVVFMLELVVGIPFGWPAILVSTVGLTAAGLVLGRARGRARPELRPPAWRLPRLSVVAAGFLVSLLVYLEALFRSGRMASIVDEWDGWAFWVPKAKAIYDFGGLDPGALVSLPGVYVSYPPGMPVLHAFAFEFMGGADVFTFHLQYWALAVAFLAAAIGLLSPHVSREILFPVLVLVVVMPSFVTRALVAYSDIPLGYLVAVAALLVVLWLEERQPWQLSAATILLAAAMVTKREGLMFTACVLASAIVASWGDRRAAWPRLALAGAVAFGVTLPWRIWVLGQGLPTESPEAGYVGALSYVDRIRPSLQLATRTLFDWGPWLAVPFVAVMAVLLEFLSGGRRIPIFVATFVLTAVSGAAWALWASPGVPFTQNDALNPIVRITGTTVLVLALLTPLSLARAWSNSNGRLGIPPRLPWLFTPSAWAWVPVLAIAAAFPVLVLAGFSGHGLQVGLPRFPAASDCVVRAPPGAPVRVVVGYATSYPEAIALRTTARAAGLQGVRIAQDGCGRLRVSVDHVRVPALAREIERKAYGLGIRATLEADRVTASR